MTYIAMRRFTSRGVALVALQMERVGQGSGPGGVHDGGVVVVVIAKVG